MKDYIAQPAGVAWGLKDAEPLRLPRHGAPRASTLFPSYATAVVPPGAVTGSAKTTFYIQFLLSSLKRFVSNIFPKIS